MAPNLSSPGPESDTDQSDIVPLSERMPVSGFFTLSNGQVLRLGNSTSGIGDGSGNDNSNNNNNNNSGSNNNGGDAPLPPDVAVIGTSMEDLSVQERKAVTNSVLGRSKKTRASWNGYNDLQSRPFEYSNKLHPELAEEDGDLAVAFVALKDELGRIERENKDPNLPAYIKARDENPGYIQSHLFTIDFLRAERYHVPRAALRILRYLDERLKLFPQHLTRTIYFEDLGDDVVEYMKRGALQILGEKDRYGRMVLVAREVLNDPSDESILVAVRSSAACVCVYLSLSLSLPLCVVPLLLLFFSFFSKRKDFCCSFCSWRVFACLPVFHHHLSADQPTNRPTAAKGVFLFPVDPGRTRHGIRPAPGHRRDPVEARPTQGDGSEDHGSHPEAVAVLPGAGLVRPRVQHLRVPPFRLRVLRDAVAPVVPFRRCPADTAPPRATRGLRQVSGPGIPVSAQGPDPGDP